MIAENPEVSICIFSYNYERYIKDAIESVLNQQTSFDYEIVIGDDYSNDNTREIIIQLQKTNPEIIRLSFNTENIGGTRNWIKTINACRGKYIAFLDGDDYFTDKNKLQKQFDCLENDSNAVLCFHAVEELYENSDRINSIVRFSKNIFTIEDIFAGGWFIRTGTTFFRNGILPQNPPEWVYDFPYRYDTILHVLLLDKGYAVYIDESMSVWRKHTMGMSLILNENIVKNMLTEISMMKQVNLYTEKKYDIFVKRYCKNLYTGLFLYLAKTGLLFRRFRIFCESLIRMNWGLTFKRLSDRIKIL